MYLNKRGGRMGGEEDGGGGGWGGRGERVGGVGEAQGRASDASGIRRRRRAGLEAYETNRMKILMSYLCQFTPGASSIDLNSREIARSA
jgi:hypothetical protein